MTTPRAAHANSGRLNLLPVMNLVTILIPLLLMSMQLVQLVVIDATAPAIADTPSPPTSPLNLSLRIAPDGIRIQGAEGLLEDGREWIPCARARCIEMDEAEIQQLTTQLARIKRAHPQKDTIVIIPTETIRYDTMVSVMDAIRGSSLDGELFPSVTIASDLSD